MVVIKSLLAVLSALLVQAQEPYLPPGLPGVTRTLASSYSYAPSVTPNVMDMTAPNSQTVCPGYKASNTKENDNGFTADLTLAGPACRTYGNDIGELSLKVEYQSKERLSVKIHPKYLAPANQSLYILSEDLTPLPSAEEGCTQANSDLEFEWSNEPSFQFKVTRKTSGEVLFNTYGSRIIYQDQFLEMTTAMVPDYNIYGLAAYIHSFRLGTNWTQTFWNVYNLDNDQTIDSNGHDTHPMYLETRYGNGSSTSHGVYARNAHGQDWLLRDEALTYRTIGGSFDLYFLSGSTPKEVISQYHTGIVGTPVMQPYWTLGFHQTRWGYTSWDNLQEVIDGYAAQNIQLESVMCDLDYMNLNRDFTLDANNYGVQEGREFLAKLHASGQYWLPILNPNIYAPNPTNKSDANPPYDRGVELDVFIKNKDDSIYYGVQWPGFSAYTDFLVPQAQQFWTEQFQTYHDLIPFDGFWLDLTDPTSFCTGSCGTGMLSMNPIRVPFALPGDPNTAVAVDYRYPESFEVTNATEAASASAAAASQSSAYPTPMATPTPVLARTLPTAGVRNLTFPPYAINNFLPGHSLVKSVLSPDALHNDEHRSTEYEMHNLYGHTSGRATYNALKTLYEGKRPFYISRSTFPGSGTFAGHWGGDTNAKWGNMYYGIAEALQFSIAGIPYFGVETCGFNGNTDMELCTRWMQLSAWYPFYRNHNNRNNIPQEAYRWGTTAEATRRIMNIRYSLIPYTYTLFHQANTAGATVLRALSWEFPNDASLAAVETQFMSGPAILITPVLEPLATTVQGVFPGVADGTLWYDWYTMSKVDVQPGENKTLEAPLEHQPIHVRGGYIIPTQQAGNTTKTSRKNPWSLLIALDNCGQAAGVLFLDDGISLEPAATKDVKFSFAENVLHVKIDGQYQDENPLANVTIAGFGATAPSSLEVSRAGQQVDCSSAKFQVENDALYISGLESVTQGGLWSSEMQLKVVM